MEIIVGKEISAVYALRITMQQMSGVDSLSDGSFKKKSKNNIFGFYFPPSFSWSILQSEAQRPNSPEVILSFFFFASWILKYAPKKCPNCPESQTCGKKKKQSFMCLSLSGAQTPNFLWISWSAKCDSSSRFWKLHIYLYIFPFIWQLVFFFITPGAPHPVTISKKVALQNKRTRN